MTLTIILDKIAESMIEIGWAATIILVVKPWNSGGDTLGPNINTLFKMYPSVNAKTAIPIMNVKSFSNQIWKNWKNVQAYYFCNFSSETEMDYRVG